MAQKIRPALILLFCLLAGAAFAASQADIKNFPPVSGQLSGQVPSGVISITVNGQPVTVDSEQNFTVPIKLKAGEKYVILTINYKGLRIIKKYLITRKQAIEKFNVYVPKEKLKKPVEVAMPAEEVSPETTTSTLPPTTTTLRIMRPVVVTTTTRQPTTTTTTLPAVLVAKMAATQKALAPSLRDRLNGFMQTFSVTEKPEKPAPTTTSTKKPTTSTTTTSTTTTTTRTTTTTTRTTTTMTTTTTTTRTTTTTTRTTTTMTTTTTTTRTTTTTTRTTTTMTTTTTTTRTTTTTTTLKPLLPTRAEVIAKIKAAPKKKPPKKPKGYQYVWEFDKGKLLVVNESGGKYYASIYVMDTGEWVNIKYLTSQELKALIDQPSPDVNSRQK